MTSNRLRLNISLGLVLVPLLGAGRVSLGQNSTAAPLPPVPLFTRDDAYLGVFFVATTVAFAPFDRHIANYLQRPDAQTHPFLKNLSTDVRVIAVPGSVIIGTSMYVIGRLGHIEKLADLGLHGEEAILVGNVINTAIKWTAGRARPYAVADTNARDFQLFRGLRKGRDYSSFPSGHTLAAFAAAAAVTSETARSWPGSQWYVGTVMYGGATAVGFSRLYNNQHWASDVIMAAGIGTFAGNKVVRYHHRTNPNNRIDRWLLSASIRPDEHGAFALGWTVIPR